jgi:hypothetical protein
LREARDLAVQAGEVDLALSAIDEMARSFAVDGPSLKMAILLKIGSQVHDADNARAIAKGFLAVVPDAVRGDNYEIATTALSKAEVPAKTAQDPGLVIRIVELRREIAALKEEYQRVKSSLDVPLPSDGEAVGRYLCFVKESWQQGLKHLAETAKAPLNTLAEKDLANPTTAEKQAEVADGWWELGQKEKNTWKRARILARSERWYRSALSSATGLLQTRIEKKLDEIESSEPGFINLLKVVDLQKDTVGGVWKWQDGALVSSDGEFARVELPYQPPPEYDFRVIFSRSTGDLDIVQILTHTGKSFMWGMAIGSRRFGFGTVRGSWLTDKDKDNPTLVELEPFDKDRRYTSLVQVRRDGVKAFIDGKLVRDYKTHFDELGPHPGYKLRNETLLGIGTYRGITIFHKVDLIEIGGKGKRSR